MLKLHIESCEFTVITERDLLNYRWLIIDVQSFVLPSNSHEFLIFDFEFISRCHFFFFINACYSMILCWITGYCGAPWFNIRMDFNICLWFVCRCARSGLRGLPALQQESLCLCSVCVFHTRAERSQDRPIRQRYQCSICPWTFFSFHSGFLTGAWCDLNISPCFTFSPMAPISTHGC